jgi:BON domain-containing protein
MANEEQQRSRMVVETPTARREVVRTETTQVPERQGFSTGAVAAMVVAAVALVTILFLFLFNQQDQANRNVAVTPATTQQQQPPIVIEQQPAPAQQPIVVQPPPAQAPVIVTAPATSAPSSGETSRSNGTDDLSIQTAIDKKILEDRTLAVLGITVVVIDGKATLNGGVSSQELKTHVEKLVKSVKGVRSVDNKLIVTAGM